MSDFLDAMRNGFAGADELQEARQDRDNALDAISSLLSAFSDLGRGYSDPDQQFALRKARAVLAKAGR